MKIDYYLHLGKHASFVSDMSTPDSQGVFRLFCILGEVNPFKLFQSYEYQLKDPVYYA